jgi:hypothetical protein
VLTFLAGISMARAGQEEITGLLKAWTSGDQSALSQLTALVY